MKTSHLRGPLRRNREGQTAVVGTILAITVVLAFLSLFTTQYVPTAMSDYEAEHMKEVEGQFALLKQTIDNQIISGNRESTLYSPIRLGSGYIPAFTASTPGLLQFDQSKTPINVTFITEGLMHQETGGGMINFISANRYYVWEEISYENGALIKNQTKGQRMIANPPINIISEGNRTNLTLTLITLIGQQDQRSGTSTVGVNTHLLFSDKTTYTNITENVTISITTSHVDAWHDFFNNTRFSDLPYFTITKAQDTVRITFGGIDNVIMTVAVVEVTLSG